MSQREIGKDRLNHTRAFTAGCCPSQVQAHTGQVKSEFYYPWVQDIADSLGVGWGGCSTKWNSGKVIILGIMPCGFY